MYFQEYNFFLRIAMNALKIKSLRIHFRSSGRSSPQLFFHSSSFCVAARVSMSVTMFLMAFGVQEIWLSVEFR